MPVLDALGFTATCYFVAGRFGGENDWDAAADTARSPLMTHADMLAWRDHGHEIGSHTLDHVALSHVPAHVSEVQIVESKQRLEALSGQTVESFCYPYGDLDPRVLQVAAAVTATRRRPGAAAPICATIGSCCRGSRSRAASVRCGCGSSVRRRGFSGAGSPRYFGRCLRMQADQSARFP